ncbi:HNH endonuclease [Citrobacter sp. CK194]|uniref:HNH endonuclease n=1 Tax=Citrobacter sp. CK194 TaxID=2985103 RepID=UPI00257867BD|nr:HNH endonuclease signature motif containing protein [Citrobacter sp. CK194]MDM3025862.1 HNH endonuclease [Citrobacter sp. CK194]
MSENRPSIPAEIKREVRKQCGFGCAICGMPFFQYDHIEEYAEVREHTADNLVLLCPNHHSAKTTKKLSPERIREAKLNPFNKNRNLTSGFKVEPSKELLTFLGSNKVTGWYPDGKGEHCPVWVNGYSFFTIHSDEGWLTVSIDITDEMGRVLLSVRRGELVVSTSAWDYEYEGDNIKIRAGLGRILLDLNLSDTKVEVLRGMFLDEHQDGFIVESDGSLLTKCNGETMMTGRNNISQGFGFGGWGMINSASVPNISPPGGFGFFFCW